MSEDLNSQKIKIDIPLIENTEHIDKKKSTNAVKIIANKKCKDIENKKRIKGNGKTGKKNYRPFTSKNPRERNACPECNSVSLQKRISTKDYMCDRCGWKGQGVIKIVY